MTDPREREPDPPDYEPEMDDDWEALMEAAHWPEDEVQCEGRIWGLYG